MHAILEVLVSNTTMAAAMAVVITVISRLGARPSLVHALWLLLLLKLVTPPIVRVPIHWSVEATSPPAVVSTTPATTTPATTMPATATPIDARLASDFAMDLAMPLTPRAFAPEFTPPAPPSDPVDWSRLVLGLWVAGVIASLLHSGWQISRFTRALRCASPAPQSLRRVTADLARRMGIRRAPELRMVPGTVSPMLWAPLGRAQLVLPRPLLGRLERKHTVTLLAHELAHLRRGDHWVRRLELLVRAIHWWNPVAWWACRELRRAEEACCDAWVLWALPRAARPYADALVETAGFLSETPSALPVAASGAGRAHDLERRLTMIMRETTRRSLSNRGRVAVLTIAAAALPLVPALAQEPAKGRFSVERVESPPEEKDPNVEDLERRVSKLQRIGDLAKANALKKKIAYLKLQQDARYVVQDPKDRNDDRARTCDALRAAIKALRKSGNDLDATMLEELLESLTPKAPTIVAGEYSTDALRLQRLLDEQKLGAGRYLVEVESGTGPSDVEQVIRYAVETDGRRISEMRKISVETAKNDGAGRTSFKSKPRVSRIERAEYSDAKARYHEVEDEGSDRIQRLEAKVDKLTNIVEKLIQSEVKKSIQRKEKPRDVYDDRRTVEFGTTGGR